MTDQNFKGHILRNSFRNEVIQNEAFDEMFGNYISFEDAKLINCSFKKAFLNSTRWKHIKFEQGTDFRFCSLKNTVFENVTFEGTVDFSGSELSGAIFRDCRFLKSDIHQDESHEKDGINFSSCVLRESVFENCTFQNSDLRGAEFHESSILETDFSGSITWHTDFYSSEIRKTSFDSSVVNESSFLYAKISRTSFRNATFTKINIESSVIDRADFTGADTRTDRFLRLFEKLQNDPTAPWIRDFPYDEVIQTNKCQITNSVFDESHLELVNLTILDGCSLRGTFLPWSCRWKTINRSVMITNSKIDNSIPAPRLDYFWNGTFNGSLIANCSWNNLDFAGCRTEGARFLRCDFENSCFTNAEFLNSIFEHCNFQNVQFARGEKLRSHFEYVEEQEERSNARRHDWKSYIRFPVKNPTDWATKFPGSQLVNCNFNQSNFDLIPLDDVVLTDPTGINPSN
jgi:uncharacterized protein YjbI with pentapeptide repeats